MTSIQREITAKKLMITCESRKQDSIKIHLEKAYEIGYADCLKDLNDKKTTVQPDIERKPTD